MKVPDDLWANIVQPCRTRWCRSRLIAANGVVAGDSFGNGHFLTSGGAMTGMIGHSARVLEYWQARDAGTPATNAIRQLADSIP